MKKRLISLIVAVVMLFSMLCPAAYADDETVSFDTCTHEWETPIRSGYSITIPGSDVTFSVKTEQCKKCKWYKHVATIFIAEFTYYSPLNVGANGLVPTELATYWANVWYNNFGKNATAEKAPSGIGRKDLPGYESSDNNPGVPSISQDGNIALLAKYRFTNNRKQLVDSFSKQVNNDIWNFGENSLYIERYSKNSSRCYTYCGYILDTHNVPGIYYVPAGTSYVFNPWGDGNVRNLNGKKWPENTSLYVGSSSSDGSKRYLCIYRYNADKVYDSYRYPEMCWSIGDGTDDIFGQDSGYSISTSGNITIPYPKDLVVYLRPTSTNIVKNTNITINNNNYSQTWNGNIYTDNSTNLTYIYPQYTTVNEKNETVTNISNTPIIYNNETKQYYTYDQTTKNYYYITYNAQPTPSPSPTPDPGTTPTPTPKPGGSISTPETGKPGGDTGDTTGILAVLVEIRDNMIQGFLDIKAAFVAGFAELSANFTLAIENLNVNIQNIFNKKFPDQSTPETALPSPTPSPSPAPLDPILPETQNLIIPKMNSNTFTDEHGTWVASGSSKYSDVFDFFYAFDRSSANFWETNSSPSNLQIEIPDPENYYIDGYIMRISKFSNRYAKEWTLQGSDDGETWYDLDTQKDQNLSDMEEHKYSLTLRKAYKYYRVNMSNYASSMCSLSHFNLLGYDAKDVVAPTPSPDTPDATPTPVPTDKPDGGNTTNNFWNIIFPNFSGDGTDSGHKGIFWALVSLILAIIAFFTNMLAGYKYLFPFLPDGVVMTINACVFVLFLFVVIKFIMRSK
jgi:hypothetical protein|nr:MAG TPA: glycoside hydrolase family protein [Inoviridae sp.]